MNYEYTIYTTVDITPTGVMNRSNKNIENYHLKRNQQRNYDTLCQVISLRSNIHDSAVSTGVFNNMPTIFPNYDLSELYTVWIMKFWCDRQHVFGDDNASLVNDLHMVPIVPSLTETVPQFPPYFITQGKLKNIHIR